MLGGETRALLAQSAKPFRMDRSQEAGIQLDRAQDRQPVKDRGEGASRGLAGRLAHPGQGTDVASIMGFKQGIETIALPGGERTRQQFADLPLCIEQGLAHHALDLGDAGHDDASSTTFVQQHPGKGDPAGGRQGGWQQPCLQIRL